MILYFSIVTMLYLLELANIRHILDGILNFKRFAMKLENFTLSMLYVFLLCCK